MSGPSSAKVEVRELRVLLSRRQAVASVHTARARRKIAVVAAARHILRLAFYVLRDGTRYEPERLRSATVKEKPEAA